METYDVVVIGGGPAGSGRDAVAGSYQRRVLILDAGQSRNRWVEQGHGYLGDDPFVPSALRRRALDDLAAYPYAELRHAPVTGVRAVNGRFGDRCDGPLS